MMTSETLKNYAHLIKQTVTYVISWILDTIIAPPCCAGCALLLPKPTILCSACAQRIKPIVSYALPLTKHKILPVHALAAYEDPLKRLILAKSWSSLPASKQLGELLWQSMGHHCDNIDYIIPIPLHWTRYAQRGYNQAEVIARVLSSYSKKPVVSLLARTKKTKYQAMLGAQEREENLKNALHLNVSNTKLYHGKRLLIVDDLMTTGATLESAAKTVLALNPITVKAVVICRVI